MYRHNAYRVPPVERDFKGVPVDSTLSGLHALHLAVASAVKPCFSAEISWTRGPLILLNSLASACLANRTCELFCKGLWT